MSNTRSIEIAKLAALIGFLALVMATYYVRSDVLSIVQVQFQAEEERVAAEYSRMQQSRPNRELRYAAEVKHFEIEADHYRKMVELFATNYEEYVKKIEDKFQPPVLPREPILPDPPEVAERINAAHSAFVSRKNQYFKTAILSTWVSAVAASLLVGGLLYLLLFDVQNSQRWHYLAVLTLSFTFLIGPALPSILSGLVGVLRD